MHEPYNYSSYSLEQLLDAQAHVNRELYPERAAEIDQWVVRRSSERSTASPPSDSATRIVTAAHDTRPLLLACGVAVVMAVSIAGVIALLIVRGRQHDEASKKVAIDVVNAVTLHWNPDDLRKNAAQEFIPVVSTPETERVFKMFRQLGRMTNLGEPVGGTKATAGIGSVRTGLTAEYSFAAKFSNGNATVRVTLAREGGRWKTTGFFVNSEAFLPK
jgi:hypothetical protein